MLLLLVLMLGNKHQPTLVTEESLTKSIQKILQDPAFKGALWGISIKAPLRDKTLYKRNEATNLRPASNMKVLTTFLAFEYLGPEYVFTTEIGRTGPVKAGVLAGDLVVRGGGDPSFSGRHTVHWSSADLLQQLVSRIKAAGIREIQGQLLADLRFFDSAAIPKSWEWSDIGGQYAVPVTPLSINDGLYKIQLIPQTRSESKLVVYPNTPQILQLDEQVRIARRKEKTGVWATRIKETNQFAIKGAAVPCRYYEWEYSSADPNDQFLHALRAELVKQGVKVGESFGRFGEVDPKQKFSRVCIWESDSLAQVGKVLMKNSQNHYADCFLKTVASEVTGDGSFTSGAKLANKLLAEIAPNLVTEGGQQIIDGSGLSAQNNLKAGQLAAILDKGLKAPYRKAWQATFPVMGVDGTLRKRGNSDTKGYVWAKTGYINRTRTLSGYVETESGEPIIFSMLANNYSCSTRKVESAQDRICALLRKLQPNDQTKKKASKLYLLSKDFPLHPKPTAVKQD